MTTGPPDDPALFARIDQLKKRGAAPAPSGPGEKPASLRAPPPAGRQEKPPARRRGRPANPATAARAALRRAAKPVWTNFGFAASVLEARLRSEGLAAVAERVRADPAVIARPRRGAGDSARARIVEALGRLSRHVATAPDPGPRGPVFARMRNDPPDK